MEDINPLSLAFPSWPAGLPTRSSPYLLTRNSLTSAAAPATSYTAASNTLLENLVNVYSQKKTKRSLVA